MEQWAQLISTVGFPIVACVGTAMFCKYLVDTYTKIITDTMNKLAQSLDELNEKIEELRRD